MGLPSDLTTITVTGTYQTITGSPLTGQVNFSLTTPVEDSTGQVIFNAFTQPAALVNGRFSIVLPCTDNADLNPTNFSYLVTEVITGLGRAYYVQLPHTLGSTVDLSSLAPVSAPPAATAFASANTWTATQTYSGNPGIKITTGAVSGDVLTSDASGNATWQPASGGFSNPMTTLGDLIYENATPAAARLAGDTSNTRKFLRTQASGGVAQAPAWDTIAAGDVPTLNQNTTGTAAGLSVTLAIGSGGTGQATQQAAIDALAGAQTSGDYLRGNGTHVQMSAIQAGDLPSLSGTYLALTGGTMTGSTGQPLKTVTTTNTTGTSDCITLCNASSGAFTNTLPDATAVRVGAPYIFKKTDTTANEVTLATVSSQTVDAASYYVLAAANASVTLISDGSNWWVF